MTTHRKEIVRTTVDYTSKILMMELNGTLCTVYEDAKVFIVKDTYQPSAPDTTKFKAHLSGSVSLESNVDFYHGYGVRDTLKRFLKIGSAIPIENRTIIANWFANAASIYIGEIGITSTYVTCTDGVTLFICTREGTRWGGIGYRLVHP